MSSTYDPQSSEIVCGSTYCDQEAVRMIVFRDNTAFPYCPDCTEYHVDRGALEYPLEECYDLTDGPRVGGLEFRDGSFRLHELGRDGSDDAWITAENCHRHRSHVTLDQEI